MKMITKAKCSECGAPAVKVVYIYDKRPIERGTTNRNEFSVVLVDSYALCMTHSRSVTLLPTGMK
jgi:hypothetical protein